MCALSNTYLVYIREQSQLLVILPFGKNSLLTCLYVVQLCMAMVLSALGWGVFSFVVVKRMEHLPSLPKYHLDFS